MINVALLGFGRIGQMHAQNIYLNKTLNLLYVYEKVDKLIEENQKNLDIEKFQVFRKNGRLGEFR